MKTNDPNDKRMNTAKMAKIDTFQFEAVDSSLVDDIAREEEARLNTPQSGNPSRAGDDGREYRFYATNSVKRMDTQTVNRMMTTSSLAIPGAPGGKRKPMTGRRMAAMLLPLAIIISYIIAVVAIDVIGLTGCYFRLTPVSVVLYVLYLALTLIGVVLLMFMDMLPKPLALLVLFVSIFCVHGNAFLMVPLILSFIAIGITIDGVYPRVAVCAIAVIMAFYAAVLGVSNAKTVRDTPVRSEDGKYSLVLETVDDGKELSYTLHLETSGTIYRRYIVNRGYVDVYYFGADDTVAFGEANEYGQPKTLRTIKITDIVK